MTKQVSVEWTYELLRLYEEFKRWRDFKEYLEEVGFGEVAARAGKIAEIRATDLDVACRKIEEDDRSSRRV